MYEYTTIGTKKGQDGHIGIPKTNKITYVLYTTYICY